MPTPPIIGCATVSADLPFWDALRQLVKSNGNLAIRRSGWAAGALMYLAPENHAAFTVIDGSRRDMHYMDAADILANDWQLVITAAVRQ